MKNSRKYLLVVVLLASLLLSACAGALSASSWPGVSADKTMAFVAYQTEVRAVRLSDHAQVWQYPEKGSQPFYAPPALTKDGKQLIVGDYNHALFSLNPASTGTVAQVNWTFEGATGRYIASPLATDNYILAPNADKTLYALDLNGKLVWSFTAKEALWGQPTVDGNMVYQPSLDHNLYALELDTGKKVWATDLGGAMLNAPTLSPDGILYTGTLNKEVVAIDGKTGKVQWHTAVSGEVWASPALSQNTLYVGDFVGDFYAINRSNGAILWTSKQDSAIVDTAALTDQGVVFGTEAGSVVYLDSNGKTLWNRTINGKLYTSPLFTGGQILVAPTQGTDLLVAFDLNGNQAWTFVPPK